MIADIFQEEMRVDQDRRQGVVDFVGDARRHLAEGRQLLGTDELVLHFAELQGPFFNPTLKCSAPLGQVLAGIMKVLGHAVKGLGKLADLILTFRVNTVAEVTERNPACRDLHL